MKTTETPPSTTVSDFIIAAVTGISLFTVLWLHDWLIFGNFLPAKAAFIGGGIMFLVIWVASKLPPKIAYSVIFIVILAVTFFMYPQA